jgi:hypothetical protein
VEELIKNAFMSETLASDSAFKNLKIHPDSIEIKRQLDPEILQQAAFIHEQVRIVLFSKLMNNKFYFHEKIVDECKCFAYRNDNAG